MKDDKVSDTLAVTDEGPVLCKYLHLRHDVTVCHYAVFMVHVWATIMFLASYNALQSFLLTEVYGVNIGELGRVTGALALADEVVSVISLYGFGILSDRIGRRWTVIIGYGLVALSLVVVPLGQSPFPDLLLLRLIYSAGASALACSITAILADYVVAADLGKATGMVGVFSGLGALTGVFLIVGQLPRTFCVANTYFVMAGIAVLILVICAVGLRKDSSQVTYLDGQRIATKLTKMLTVGFKLAYHNKKIALAYVAGFLARGGSVIVTVYISLWVNKYFVERDICSELNITELTNSICNEELINPDKRTCPLAFTEASRISGIAQTAALVFALIFGILGDKFDEVKVVAFTAALGVVCYGLVGIVPDPEAPISNVVGLLWGVAEIGMIVAAQFLVTKHMPEEFRGAVAGCFSLFGSVGIIFIVYFGGYLFDVWYEGAPFVVAAVLSFVVLCTSLYVLATDSSKGVVLDTTSV